MKALSLTDEQRAALARSPEGIEIEDPETESVYILTDATLHQKAIEALRKIEDLQAIQEGIEDIEAGRTVPFEQVDFEIRQRLGLPPRT